MKDLIRKIQLLKKKKHAIILCHNYQRPEIYAVADFTGDSLELCIKAQQETSARLIVFSGVYFMAESAAILNPSVKVLIPSGSAGCALSDMITADALRKKKLEYPDAAVVCYVNSSAAVKAESDICCTSSNAVSIVRALPQKRILFVPDKNLAAFIAKQVPEKKIIPWDGYCPIHQRLSAEYLLSAKKRYPNAKVIAHPECTEEVRAISDYVVSTSGMMKVAKESDTTEFICTTECGMIQRMKKEMPDKQFYTLCSVCFDMKKNSLETIEESLRLERYEVIIPKGVRKKAFSAFDRMFKIQNPLNRSSLLVLSNDLYKDSVSKHTIDELKLNLREFGDITTKVLFPKEKKVSARIITCYSVIFAGEQEIIYFLGKTKLKISFLKHDGDKIKANETLAVITGDIREILRVERVALNLIGRMSGIATAAYNISKKVKHANPNILITPTRKTLWGLLDKRACALGGAGTHRLNLSDAILIKDNHLDANGRNIAATLKKFFPLKRNTVFIEIEVENKEEARKAADTFKKLQAKKLCTIPCFIMLDNMPVKKVKETLTLLKQKGLRNNIGIEVSGGINENNVLDYAKTEVDIISMGCLIHSARMLDVSLVVNSVNA